MASLMIRLTKKSGPISEDGGDDDHLEHKNIARALKQLDALAAEAKTKPLSSFISEDPENVFDLVDDEDEAEELMEKLPPVKWFAPADALLTVTALITRVAKNGADAGLKNPAKLTAELQDLKTVLEVGVKKKATFRLYKEF